VVPIAVALLPGAIPAITAQGNFNAGINVASSLLFDWSGSFGTAGGIPSFSIAPSANFAPPGVSMTPSEASLATNLTNAWNNADRSYAAKFGFLSQIDSARVYTATLDAFSARATQAQSLALANSAGTILGASMSCPVFVDRSVLLGEDNCVWAKVTGQQSNQWQSSDTAGYQVASALYRIGGQHAIAPDWYLGGSLAAGQTWASANGGSSGHGHTFDGSVALKHTMGPWTIGGAVALASGAFHSSRVVSLPAVGTLPAVYAVESSDPSIFVAGGRLRAAYEFTFGEWYVRPFGDLDVIYTHTPGFAETGQAGYALDVRGNSKTSVVLSPMVEVGGRAVLDERTVLRPYAALGVSFLPNNTRYVDASFVGALPGDGTFRGFVKAPGVLGDLEVGAQLYFAGGFEVKAEYGVRAGGSYLSQSGSARVAYHF
jgi:uncharacterized protein with beta-barrel porin domain